MLDKIISIFVPEFPTMNIQVILIGYERLDILEELEYG